MTSSPSAFSSGSTSIVVPTSSTTSAPSTSTLGATSTLSTSSEVSTSTSASSTLQTSSSTSNSLVAPTASQPPLCPGGNGTAYTDLNGRAYRIWCDVDSQPGSYRGTAEASFQACINACDADTRCGAVGFNPDPDGAGGCYFKTGSTSLQTSIGQELAIYIPAQSGAAPVSADLCPSGNGTTFTDRNGFVYMLYCGSDSSPGAFNSSSAPNFRSCIAMCDEQTSQPCRAVAFTGDDDGGTCYFKIAPDSITGSSGVQLAVWQGLAGISTSTIVVDSGIFYCPDNQQHLCNASNPNDIDLDFVRDFTLVTYYLPCFIFRYFIFDFFNLGHFIFGHFIFDHLIFGHFIFDHLIFGLLIFGLLIFAHFTFGHSIFNYLIFDYFVAHVHVELNRFPISEQLDRYHQFKYDANVRIKLFGVFVLLDVLDRVVNTYLHHGSTYVFVCNQDFKSSRLVGVDSSRFTNLTACVDFCTAQGTACAGITFGTFGGSTTQCYLHSRMQESDYPGYTVTAAVRASGPITGPVRKNLVTNGRFANGLTSWLSQNSNNSNIAALNGLASVTMSLASQSSKANGAAIDSSAILYQTFPTSNYSVAGVQFFLAVTLGVTVGFNDSCNVAIGTGGGDSFYSALYAATTSRTVYAAGVIDYDFSQLTLIAECVGRTDASLTYTNVTLLTYAPSPGSTLSCHVEGNVILNNGFNTALSPWTVSQNTSASFAGIASGQYVVRYAAGTAPGGSSVLLTQGISVPANEYFTSNADLYFTVGGNGDVCSVRFSDDVETLYATNQIYSSQYVPINFSGQFVTNAGA
ncbi:hypothetical protein LTR95_012663 [Oleoguttula sp. CCFEE 5521]